MVKKDRLIELFLELVRIDSPSKAEGQIAQRLVKELKALGLSVKQDQAGNIIALLKGTLLRGKTILLNAHMDTVAPGENIKPLLKGERITSDGSSILGADDKAGIAVIIELLRILKENHVPHGDIKVIFTVEEEIGLLGAKKLANKDVEADYCFVLDADGVVGTVINKGPAQDTLEVKIKGRPAHAGICPEKGISAIQIAAKAIAGMKLGRLDSESTANIGMIQGGTATNIVPEEVVVRGEARSHSEEKLRKQVEHMRARFRKAAEQAGGKVEISVTRAYDKVHVPNNSQIVQLTRAVAGKIGLKSRVLSSGGGSDASIIYGLGVPTVAIGIGMENVHSKSEYIRIKDLHNAARYVLALVQEASK